MFAVVRYQETLSGEMRVDARSEMGVRDVIMCRTRADSGRQYGAKRRAIHLDCLSDSGPFPHVTRAANLIVIFVRMW